MKVADLVNTYVAYKRSLGMRYRSQAAFLNAFTRSVGDADIREVTPSMILAFIAGKGTITTTWQVRFNVLNGLYQFAICRGLVAIAPLPTVRPAIPSTRPPYIYSTDEIKLLLSATDSLARGSKNRLRAATLRMLLLLLYGSGLRISEALSLTLQDLKPTEDLLTVRGTKFFKTRWVPIGPRLAEELRAYLSRRCELGLCDSPSPALFVSRTGRAWSYRYVLNLFVRVRRVAGIGRERQGRSAPRLHDLRHTAAVHRVLHWYRTGADVQRLLLPLATYLGHVEIASTQRYLTMTPELLHEAGKRFEQYAQGDVL